MRPVARRHRASRGDDRGTGPDRRVALQAPQARPRCVERTVPLVQDLRHYRLSSARIDVLAGVTVAALAVPASMAYAELAGLSPVVGLYALILPAAAYALLGSSRPLSVGPEGGVSALVAAAILPLAVAGSAHGAELAAMLALMVGVLLRRRLGAQARLDRGLPLPPRADRLHPRRRRRAHRLPARQAVRPLDRRRWTRCPQLYEVVDEIDGSQRPDVRDRRSRRSRSCSCSAGSRAASRRSWSWCSARSPSPMPST